METRLGSCLLPPLLSVVALKDSGDGSDQLHVRPEGQSGYPLKDKITLGALLRLLCPGIELPIASGRIGHGQVFRLLWGLRSLPPSSSITSSSMAAAEFLWLLTLLKGTKVVTELSPPKCLPKGTLMISL